MDFLISELCSVRLVACRAAFLADLIIGIIFPIYIKINNLQTIITLLSKNVKGEIVVFALEVLRKIGAYANMMVWIRILSLLPL